MFEELCNGQPRIAELDTDSAGDIASGDPFEGRQCSVVRSDRYARKQKRDREYQLE